MSEKMVEEKIIQLQDRYSLHWNSWTNVTVRLQKWIYHGQRVTLTIVEDLHSSSEQIDKAIDSFGKNPNIPDYPKHLEITCRPEEMLELAKALTEICTQKNNP